MRFFTKYAILSLIAPSVTHLQCIQALAPGSLRRQLFGSPPKRVVVPEDLIDTFRETMEGTNSFEDILSDMSTSFTRGSLKPHSVIVDKMEPLPSHSRLAGWLEDKSVLAQQEIRQKSIPKFIHTIKPSDVSIHPSDKAAQKTWLYKNAAQLKMLKHAHGAVFFQGWDLLKDADGLNAAAEAVGLEACPDPVEGVRPEIGGKSGKVYEGANNEKDSATHVGMHYEAAPSQIPLSAFFACFEAADSGGEFLVCDGRRVLRDIDTKTLSTFQSRKHVWVLNEFSSDLSSAPGVLKYLPFANEVHREMMTIGLDLMSPFNAHQYKVVRRPNEKESQLAVIFSDPVPVTIRNPATGLPNWFCTLDATHRDTFNKRNPNAIKGQKFTSNNLDIVHGDFGKISEKDLENSLAAIKSNTVEIAMKPGDGMLLDNLSVTHGRKPFSGKRKHAVVWASN
mmetsp:Transcript_12860/g.19927  ORF Transcript_12860/g.19927 Transcript_12860/m.19927 type:complete len:450 (+) Transcript_12860:70-1419(+)